MEVFGRSPVVYVDIAPPVLTPGQTVTAVVSSGRPLGAVRAAVLQWGYTNYYRYHWGGRPDSVLAEADNAAWLFGGVGVNSSDERDADDWVGVAEEQLTIEPGRPVVGTSRFTIPVWAPPSSPELVRWSCRVVVQRGGRDIDAHGEFEVKVGPADVAAEHAAVETLAGDGATVIEVTLNDRIVLVGSTIRGDLRLTPRVDLPDGDVAVCWRKCRLSHPAGRRAARGGAIDGPVAVVGDRIRLVRDRQVILPFHLPVPAEAAPSASAVHSSIRWFVHVRLFYAGFPALRTERVLLPITVVNDLAHDGG
ncbi:MAG: hypothetical protein PGN30_00850 [Mycolicibacterium neoaurum]|uniref:hypothetical protein n=1 Tax=Mycolicibacterium neoaurum TaxID=1795 RepID=UPI002FF96AB7